MSMKQSKPVKLRMSWKNNFGSLSPFCETGALNDQGLDLLACILMDDGGIPYIETVEWLDHALVKINFVESIKVRTYDWDRESWYASIAGNSVNITSLHDESCSQTIQLATFQRALIEWKRFLQSIPKQDSYYDVNI